METHEIAKRLFNDDSRLKVAMFEDLVKFGALKTTDERDQARLKTLKLFEHLDDFKDYEQISAALSLAIVADPCPEARYLILTNFFRGEKKLAKLEPEICYGLVLGAFMSAAELNSKAYQMHWRLGFVELIEAIITSNLEGLRIISDFYSTYGLNGIELKDFNSYKEQLSKAIKLWALPSRNEREQSEAFQHLLKILLQRRLDAKADSRGMNPLGKYIITNLAYADLSKRTPAELLQIISK